MGKLKEKSLAEKLQLLGKWQLGTYLFILVWMIVFESLWVANSSFNFVGQEKGFPVMWAPFALLGGLLIPSALTFIQTGKKSQTQSIVSARTLQVILFVLVLLLTMPAYGLFSMLWMHGVIITFFSIVLSPCYFIACVLGIVSFPIMWNTTKYLLSETIQVSAEEYQNLIKQ
jgi:hypothetical protein